MAEMKPETKIKRLIERMQPLANWMEKNKPKGDTLRLAKEDMALLLEHQAEALGEGIYVEGGAAKWRNFYLRPAP